MAIVRAAVRALEEALENRRRLKKKKRGLLPSCNCCVDVRSSSHDRAVLLFPGSVIRDLLYTSFRQRYCFRSENLQPDTSLAQLDLPCWALWVTNRLLCQSYCSSRLSHPLAKISRRVVYFVRRCWYFASAALARTAPEHTIHTALGRF